MFLICFVFLVRGFVDVLDFKWDLGPLIKRSRNRKTSLKCSERVRPSKRPAHPSGRGRIECRREAGRRRPRKEHSASCGACDLSGSPFLSGQPLKS